MYSSNPGATFLNVTGVTPASANPLLPPVLMNSFAPGGVDSMVMVPPAAGCAAGWACPATVKKAISIEESDPLDSPFIACPL